MKLKEGQTMTIGGRTYKDEVPDELMKEITDNAKKMAKADEQTENIIENEEDNE